MRLIPATMATQHPDNAGAPAWLREGGGFINAWREVDECAKSFCELGCTEYMWDWEGKHVDEAVVERLLEGNFQFFRQKQLGRDVFLTYRLPNVWVEKGYRIARAFVNIISSNDIACELGLHAPPVFETILPLTTQGRQTFLIKKNYAEVAKALRLSGLQKTFDLAREAGPEQIDVIPLIEHPDFLLQTGAILEEYSMLVSEDGGAGELAYIRPFIARSDPALNNGIVAATLSAKASLSECEKFSETSGIPVHPMIGVGSLHFRGGLSPEKLGSFTDEYAGVRTVTIQSAFRYDYGEREVKAAIGKLNSQLSGRKAGVLDAGEMEKLARLVQLFSTHYQKTVEAVADDINAIAKFIPARRERKQHVGLFGYSRKVSGKALPRAIGFTAAMYSFGVPPEFIGLGAALREAEGKGLTDALEENYRGLRSMIEEAGRFINHENLTILANKAGWKFVENDVKLAEEWLGKPLGPQTAEELAHRNATSNILMLYSSGKDCTADITRAAQIRKSMG
ncbi:phosphoenolpyruvate carboxylase [Candidatus Micrarchaeota archaeon]|nr:phosphoenolpyruvate carboxylase [Candidatus Micrarchaeota archaeon]